MQIITRLINATRYSLSGLAAAWRHEQAFRLDIIACIILIPAALFMPFQHTDKLILVLLALLLLVIELVNTAIEAAINRISDEQHELSKIAKDCGSAAVFIVIVMNTVGWCFALANL